MTWYLAFVKFLTVCEKSLKDSQMQNLAKITTLDTCMTFISACPLGLYLEVMIDSILLSTHNNTKLYAMPQFSTPQGLLEKLRGLNSFWNKIVETLCHIMLDVSLSSCLRQLGPSFPLSGSLTEMRATLFFFYDITLRNSKSVSVSPSTTLLLLRAYSFGTICFR